MVWMFVLITVLALRYVLHVGAKVGGRAPLAGLFLVLATLCAELVNPLLDLLPVVLTGPFWIAEGSVLRLTPGLPVEKLVLYLVAGTWVAEQYARHARLRTPSGRWATIAVGAGLLAGLEFVLNYTTALRWIRPWVVFTAFTYYGVLLFALLEFYDGSPRSRAVTLAVLAAAAVLLAVLQPGLDEGFPRVVRVAPH